MDVLQHINAKILSQQAKQLRFLIRKDPFVDY